MRYLFILLLLASCGARKVNKSTTETETKSEITVVDSTKVYTNEISEGDIHTDEFEITPVDTLKPIVIIDSQGKKTTIKNGRIKKRTQISRFKALKSQSVHNTRKTQKTATQSTKASEKHTERTQSFWWLWLILIIAVILYIYRRFFISRFI
jgi:predicted metal-dependent phosphotriesterase family hydrolase